MRRHPPDVRAAAALALLLALAPAEARGAPRRLRVMAAASLTDVLTQIARAWRRSGGGEVAFSFEATSRLALQAEAGAPADLFFSADRRWMDHLEAKGLLAPSTRTDLLANRLILAVPASASWVPAGPADLAGPGLHRLALASEQAPAGAYARQALRALGMWEAVAARVVSGDNVRVALAWTARGEADAAVVYATDALVEPRVRAAFVFPEDSHGPIVFPAAVLAASADPGAAAALLAFCRGPAAQAVLQAAGFAVLPVGSGADGGAR